MLYGSTAFAVLFFLITVLPSLSLQDQIRGLESLREGSKNSTEKGLIDREIEFLTNQLNLSESRILEAEIPNFPTLSVVTRDVISVFPLIIGISQLLYLLVLRDLFNLRAEIHRLYVVIQKPNEPIRPYLKIAAPLWIDPLSYKGGRSIGYWLQFSFLLIPYLITTGSVNFVPDINLGVALGKPIENIFYLSVTGSLLLFLGCFILILYISYRYNQSTPGEKAGIVGVTRSG